MTSDTPDRHDDPVILDDETGLPLWKSVVPVVQQTDTRIVEPQESGDVTSLPRKPAVRKAFVDPRKEGWVDLLADALFGPDG